MALESRSIEYQKKGIVSGQELMPALLTKCLFPIHILAFVSFQTGTPFGDMEEYKGNKMLSHKQ